ncbi:MAG: hypothetical protein ABSA30_14360, partial [Candidatus Aminicenantales bacterium]
QERLLLILDGVEPLQDPSGALRDAALKALLQELDTANRGLVVSTTRLRMDILDDPPRVLSLDLDNLTPEQGAEYLRHLKVEGTDEELQQASREYWNHALALTLLGTYLTDFCGADIRRRVEIPKLMVEETREGAHASRVIAGSSSVETSFGPSQVSVNRIKSAPAVPSRSIACAVFSSPWLYRATLTTRTGRPQTAVGRWAGSCPWAAAIHTESTLAKTIETFLDIASLQNQQSILGFPIDLDL